MDTADTGQALSACVGNMKRWRKVDQWTDGGQQHRQDEEKEDEQLVEMLLHGKAPWGFTLRGGTEHREPLLITKIEEGSMAASAHLQPGDELVSVNAVPLSGSRQEAICLVKSTHKTLALVVRRAEMVDVVSPQTMPSETDINAARSFLTKILRSSMRRNDLSSRPQSWHSSKLTEEDTSCKQATPTTVWKHQPQQHEARPKESSTQGDKENQAQLTSQFSSLNIMERLDQPSNHNPPGHISPTKYLSGTEPPFAPGGKKDLGLNCFSSDSSGSVYDNCTSTRKGNSAETIFFKGFHGEGPQHAERPKQLQTPVNRGWEGLCTEDHSAIRVSVAGRPSVGPVWQAPEKMSQSPPLLAPSLRNDSFAATKVFPFSEGNGGQTKSQRLTENNTHNEFRPHQEKLSETRRSFNLHPNMATYHNQNQLHPNKLFSLSSNDIRQSHYTQLPVHQRQYSDESPLYLQTKAVPSSKTQTVGSYYRSLQDLPLNAFNRKNIRHSTASMTGSATKPALESGGHSRYYSLAGKHSLQTKELQARQGKSEGLREEVDKQYWMNSKPPGFQSFLKTNIGAKHSVLQSQMPYRENIGRNGHPNLRNGQHYDHKTSELSCRGSSSEDTAKRDEGLSNDTKRQYPTHQSKDLKVSHSRHQDPWVPQEDHRITSLKTPLLHSLAKESRSLTNRQPADTDTNDSMDTVTGKANRRSDRYATTLRKEIQQKRAQLQKSRSAATLTCDAEDKEADEWKSTETSSISFSSTYKENLKEAQARVLQATSFQRRDLEPNGPEGSVAKANNGRIRGCKRLTQAKRAQSFSEPDKIDKLGVEGEHQTGSFGERKRFFESKPAFSRPVLKPSHVKLTKTDLGETDKTKERTLSGEPDKAHLSTGHLRLGHKVLLEQQRLGTFAEYQATWNKKKSMEAKTKGRYHSAENILDTNADEKAICIHERSRSSPSADFCTQAENRDQRPSPVRLREDLVLTDQTKNPKTAADPFHSSAGLSLNVQHLTPQNTYSSHEPLARAYGEPVSSSGSDLQQAATPSFSTFPTPADLPHPKEMSRPDISDEGVEETEREKTALSLPSDRSRSPSPQFSPLRLTDKPPAAQNKLSLRSANDLKKADFMDANIVRKVPIRIVHSDTSEHQEERAYLSPTTDAFEPCPCNISLGSIEHPTSSSFSLFTRQDTTQAPAPPPSLKSVPESSLAGAHCSEEDAKREELVRDIMGRDKSLVDVLDQSGRKTTMDLMEGLFPQEEQVLEGAQQRKRTSGGPRLPTSSPRSTERREDEEVSASAAASLVPSSSYYNTSAPKAELLIKMKDMQEQLEEQDSEEELEVDLASKKQELISSLARKLEVLREARKSLQDDVEDNDALGREVEATVQRLCQPNQLDKFRMFVGDLDKVVSLLLSLSGRLARVENALNSLEEEAPPEEKRTLTDKRKILMRQHEDAKELKENLDRRERLVSSTMEAHLDAGSLDDYRHFVKMKSALIIEQRKLEDKIKLGEEQLKCLVDSLPLEQRPLL